MTHGTGAAFALAAAISLVAAPIASTQQAAPSATKPVKAPWTPPKTPWGDPDISGLWPTNELQGVPLQRPERFGERAELTDTELAEREAAIKKQFPGFTLGAWGEQGKPQRTASFIVDPPNGRRPPMTPEGERRAKLMRASWDTAREELWNGPEDFDTWDRCISRGVLLSMLPGMYSNGLEITQAPGYVIIKNEIVHEARVVPLDGRPHLPRAIKSYMGDPRGRWEGTTLVVDSTNFNGFTQMSNPGLVGSTPITPASETLHLVERFTRVAPDRLNYEMTIDDPTIFTRPWKVAMPLRLNPDYEMFEYACHEGNYALPNLITGSQAAREKKLKSGK
jgi:hypothetical protein